MRRFDPHTGKLLATIRLPGTDTLPQGIAITSHGVWVACHHAGTVVRIDPSTDRVTQTIRVTSPGIFGPSGVLATGQDVWVAVPKGTQVVRIDARTGHIVRRVRMNNRITPCNGMAATSRSLWIADCGDPTRLARIDVRTNRTTKVLDLGQSTSQLAASGDDIWFVEDGSSGSASVVRLNDNGRPESRYRLGSGFTTGGITIGLGAVWIGSSSRPVILRIPLLRPVQEPRS